MNRKSLSKYPESMSVSESGSVTPETAAKWTDPKREEISMVFQFQHVNNNGFIEKPRKGKDPLVIQKLKDIFTNWEKVVGKKVWLGLFWSNHDQPRPVSRWGSVGKLQERSAKALAYILHFMKGTPYIYQGEEFAMANGKFTAKDQLDDLSAHNAYDELVGNELTHEEMMVAINYIGRDTGRTPVCWNDTKNAGFTTGKPWLKVNEDFEKFNAKKALESPDSTFYHYKKLIKFRKENPSLIVDGDYELLKTQRDVWAYIRTDGKNKLLVVANLSEKENGFSYPGKSKRLLMKNTDSYYYNLQSITLKPFEAFALFV
jgi:glucan 1,6-alpha-glucosidase